MLGLVPVLVLAVVVVATFDNPRAVGAIIAWTVVAAVVGIVASLFASVGRK